MKRFDFGVSQTPEQLLLREDAATANAEYETLAGRTMQDLRETLAYLAVGRKPETVLGGLLNNIHGPFDSVMVPGRERDEIEVSVRGRMTTGAYDERGDTVADVLEGYVDLGLVERVYTPDTVEAALLKAEGKAPIMDRPTYRIAAREVPTKVQATVDFVTDAQQELEDYEAKREKRKIARQERGGRFALRRRRSE